VLNWSPLAKSINAAGFIAILLLTRDARLATSFALVLLTLKCYSMVRLLRLRPSNAWAGELRLRAVTPLPAPAGSP
jgi:hypothetical protein